MKRGKVIAATALGIALLVTVILIVRFAGGSATGSPAPVAAPSPSTSTPAVPAEGDVTRLSDNLASGDEQRVRQAVAIPPDQPLDQAAVADLKARGKLTFELSTFHALGNGTAEIIARDAQQTRWAVGLVIVDGAWRIETTEAKP